MTYVAMRLLGVLVLAWLCAANHKTLTHALSEWDGQWYLQIAAHGYSGVNPDMVDAHGHRTSATPLAFFPGYPELIRVVRVVPGISVLASAIIVSLVSGIVAAYGLTRLARKVDPSPRVGLLFVALFASAPMSIVLSMAYTEALFVALAVWALIGVLERRWLLAGACCAIAGVVRLTAAALVAVVMLAALIAIIRRRDTWRPWLGMLLAPTGLALYLGWVGIRTGSPNGYFVLQQRGWSSAFDGGIATMQFVIQTLTTNKSVMETMTVWISLVGIMLLVLCVRDRLPWPLIAFALLVIVEDLGSNGLMYSKVRLMLPAFPLLLPIASGLAKRRTATATCAMIAVAGFGLWFGAYSLTAWQYAI